MTLKIKNYLRSSVAQNAASLYIILFANYLLPLVTVPYVVRVLTPFGYGLVAFGSSLVGYFVIFIDYGFSYSATRKISVLRHDLPAVSRTACSVWAAKLLLCLIGFLVLVLLVRLVPTLRQNRGLLFILYALTLGNVLFPGWLFQGLERMIPISVINLIVRFIVVLSIFALIKKPEDYLLYAGLGSLGSIAVGIVGISWAAYQFRISLVMPSPKDIWLTIKEGWLLFLSQASVSLYTVGNAFILGMLTNTTVVGYYSAGEKIVQAVLGLIRPIAQAAYPRFSQMAADSKPLAMQWGRRMFFLLGGLGMALSVILVSAAPLLVRIILSVKYAPSINVIRVLAFLPVLVGLSNVFGIQIMLPFGKDKHFTFILFVAGLINLFTACALSPVWQEVGMAFAVLISEAFVTLSMFGVLWKYQLNPLANWNKVPHS